LPREAPLRQRIFSRAKFSRFESRKGNEAISNGSAGEPWLGLSPLIPNLLIATPYQAFFGVMPGRFPNVIND
jgi:hypothetical protein